MFRGKKIAVVIPVHNEEKFILSVIRDIPEYVDFVCIVDDASTDGTFSILEKIDDPRIHCFRNESNLGVGGATKRGYVESLKLGCDVVVKADGDGQMPMHCLEKLIEPVCLNECSYAKGNRFLDHSGLETMPALRFLGNIILTFCNKFASGYWHIFDPQNGFTAICAKTLEEIDLDKVHNRFFFENDMLLNLNINSSRVRDVSIPTLYGNEESDIRIMKIVFTFPFLFMKRFARRVVQKYILLNFSPIALFLIAGFILDAWGLFFGLFHWYLSIKTGIPATTGTVMLSVLPFILGFQLILQAIVLDIQETPA
ncbi:MAG: glycosyl transferase family 2 [Candidatus Wallbacteria bacterium HGW-Wallbacteria-1]|jgi:glycosyltransferase involved in cell wall biosynthesis|uniref:Glycosyl transferase family 2 n=1 Tax=Candidatus Wallbacteria bacterium HGW-Wallbacteria-1 TaxID=2013854 RepID=A0A2N1PN04_9BACT|nr:MAG: glycosyl transferase family 2 [Candidatus Wallbacteria bacterium HGW-Wallbacteria-1]